MAPTPMMSDQPQPPEDAPVRPPSIPRQSELALLRRLLELCEHRRTDQLDSVAHVADPDRYLSPEWHARELHRVFRNMPVCVGPSALIPEPGDAVALERMGTPVIVLRDASGLVRAHINACRHRGGRLLAPGYSQCKGRITCPYHAWSYGQDGQLVHVPREQFFGPVDRARHGLLSLPAAERFGQIWLSLDQGKDVSLDDHLSDVAADVAGYQFDSCRIVASRSDHWRVNWKLAVESGLEAYHLQTLHKATIARLFMHDIMTFDQFGPHVRVAFPRRTLPQLADTRPEMWQMRKHVNLVYYLAPNAMLLVDHRFAMMFIMDALSVGETHIASYMLVHEADLAYKPQVYWDKNFEATMTALDEDYVMAENIQRNLRAGAHPMRVFGRNEIGLQVFHRWLEHLTRV